MTEIRHFPPAGQHLIGSGHKTSSGGECPCKPTRNLVTKRNAMGRFGRHQGSTLIRIEWHHNFIEPKQQDEKEPGLKLVPSEARYAAREDAWLARTAQQRAS